MNLSSIPYFSSDLDEELQEIVDGWNIGHLGARAIVLVKSEGWIALNSELLLDLLILLHTHIECNKIDRDVLLFDNFCQFHIFWHHMLTVLALWMVCDNETSMTIHVWGAHNLIHGFLSLQFKNSIILGE